MAARDWDNDALARAWRVHSQSNGDVYRQLLINPIVQGLLKGAGGADCEAPLMAALDDWLSKHAKGLGQGPAPALDWYSAWHKHRGPGHEQLQILDLGCGDAYRGRWLSCKGVYYKGVDCSRALLDMAGVNAADFDLQLEDLDTGGALARIWPENRPPPNWVFLITVLDHLANPRRLMQELAQRYSAGNGKFLVVTCNSRFYRQSPSKGTPVPAQIATLPQAEGQVQVYFRSRTELRRLFRDAGLHILDELSPTIPSLVERFCETPDAARFNPSVPPLHFWLLQACSAQRQPATASELREWHDRLPPGGDSVDAVRLLLSSLLDQDGASGEVFWRHIASGAPLIRKLNPGGRIFIVQEGELALFDSASETPGLSFGPNDLLGELETYAEGKERERVYPMTVLESAVEKQPAKVLEISAPVVQRFLSDPACLGNPLHRLLRRRVMQALLRRAPIKWKPQNFEGPGASDVAKRVVVTAAELLVAALESDRKRSTDSFDTRRSVFIADVMGAVRRLFGLAQKAPVLNRAFDLLRDAGVIRVLRFHHQPELAKLLLAAQLDPPLPSDTTEADAVRRRLEVHERRAIPREFMKRLTEDQKEVYRRFADSQGYCMFLIEDIMMLQRCAITPSEDVFKALEQRVRAFRNPSDAAVVRRFDDMCMVSLIYWKRRLASDNWRVDSLGVPVLARSPR